jgi:hypothetical protein
MSECVHIYIYINIYADKYIIKTKYSSKEFIRIHYAPLYMCMIIRVYICFCLCWLWIWENPNCWISREKETMGKKERRIIMCNSGIAYSAMPWPSIYSLILLSPSPTLPVSKSILKRPISGTVRVAFHTYYATWEETC